MAHRRKLTSPILPQQITTTTILVRLYSTLVFFFFLNPFFRNQALLRRSSTIHWETLLSSRTHSSIPTFHSPNPVTLTFWARCSRCSSVWDTWPLLSFSPPSCLPSLRSEHLLLPIPASNFSTPHLPKGSGPVSLSFLKQHHVTCLCA